MVRRHDRGPVRTCRRAPTSTCSATGSRARTTVANDFFVDPGPLGAAGAGPLAHRLPARSPRTRSSNFEYVGYQPALTNPTPDDLIAAELVATAPDLAPSSATRTCERLPTRCAGAPGGARCGPMPTAGSPLADRSAATAADEQRRRHRRTAAQGPVGLARPCPAPLADPALPRAVLRHRRDRVRWPRPDLRLRRSPLEPAARGTSTSFNDVFTDVVNGSPAQRLPAHVRATSRSPSRCASSSATRSPTTWPATPVALEALLLALHRPAVLDELPDADAGVGEPAQPRGRLGGGVLNASTRPPSSNCSGSATAATSGSASRSPSCSASCTATSRSSSCRCTPASTGSTPASSRRPATSAPARARPFLRVTLPLSVPGILAASVITALPMFGDYYTNTILSGSPGDADDRQPDRARSSPAPSSRRRAPCWC